MTADIEYFINLTATSGTSVLVDIDFGDGNSTQRSFTNAQGKQEFAWNYIVFLLRIDYGDARVIRGSSTKMLISQPWIVIFRHAIHH